jgi:lipopolysaccharide export system protein LptC
MAELLVQRKKRSPLPWVILALLILAIVGYLIWRNQHVSSDTTPAPVSDTTQHAPDNGANRNP